MHHNAVDPRDNTLVVHSYIRIDSTWDWSVCVQKAVLALMLLAGFLLGGEDLEIILKHLLN
jgi:hypothetical protein